MLSLSPAKILVVLVIALLVLGPDKLPDLARQLGGMWGDLRRWRTRVESEVRSTFPDLPPTHEVVQAVRSPLSFLDRLADHHERATSAEEVAPPTGSGTGGSDPPSVARTNGGGQGTPAQRAPSNETAALPASASGASGARPVSAEAATDGHADGASGAARGRPPSPADSAGRSSSSRDEPEWVYDDPSMN